MVKVIPVEDIVGPTMEYHVDPQDRKLVLIESTISYRVDAEEEKEE